MSNSEEEAAEIGDGISVLGSITIVAECSKLLVIKNHLDNY